MIHYKFQRIYLVLGVCLLLTLQGCNQKRLQENQTQVPTDGKDLFTSKVEIRHAKGFQIQYYNNYKVVTILNPFDKSGDKVEYVLFQRGTPPPNGFDPARTIEIPIRSLVATSSIHVGLIDFLEEQQVLVGLGNLKYVSSPEVIKLIEEGKILEVGKGQGLNEERLIEIHPDLVMITGSTVSNMERHSMLTAAGIPVLINSEWVEKTPLARAEWVKLLAALMNKEAVANEKFTVVENEYKRLVEVTSSLKNRPSVITGTNSKDAWFVPNGDSYMAQFFRDAGAAYYWDTQKATGSLPLNFEAVYPVALEADVWLDVNVMGPITKQELAQMDVRYADFKSFKENRIYTYNKRINERGSNDYWESGVANPHIILSDLIRILHPSLLPNHELVYYNLIR
jgi:iron complex transport system substrate-binding protein